MGAYPELAATNVGHRFYSLEEFFSSASLGGYELAELWTGPMHLFLDHAGHDPLDEVERLSAHYGVRFCAVCPEQNNPKPANVAARGERTRARTLSYFENAIDVAVELGAAIVTVTSGWAFLDESTAGAWARSVSMLRRISAYAGRRGVTLALEALQSSESVLVNTASDVRRILDDVGSSALGCCLDLGAMEAAGDTIPGYFSLLGDRVVHCHFVDVGEQTHLAWGDGHRDMRADLDALVSCGYGGVCTVETCDEKYLRDPVAADRRAMAIYRMTTGGDRP